MNKMVEQVANALFPTAILTGGVRKRQALALARTAIKAMRELTPEMRFVGIQEEFYGVEIMWKSMIDTALQEFPDE